MREKSKTINVVNMQFVSTWAYVCVCVCKAEGVLPVNQNYPAVS